MRYRPIDSEPLDPRLGRLIPDDFEHLTRYPLTTATLPPKPVPVAMGVNWHAAFDHPQVDSKGLYWVGRDGNLGAIRGGHCVCLIPSGMRDPVAYWDWFNQGREGACVGYGCSRMMALLNHRRYFCKWLWDRAKEADEWPDTNPGDDNGTSVRAALEVLRTQGHVPWKNSYRTLDDQPADSYPRSQLQGVTGEGIAAYRWAMSVDDLLTVLGRAGQDAAPFTNSWGRAFPHVVWIPASVLQRLLDEQGEFGLVTDR